MAGPSLYHFNFMRACLCIGDPYGGGVLELWVYNGLICSLTVTFMFSFDVSFDKTQRFICVLADSVYMLICVLKFKLVDKSTPKYLSHDTLSRAFQEILTDFADQNR